MIVKSKVWLKQKHPLTIIVGGEQNSYLAFPTSYKDLVGNRDSSFVGSSLFWEEWNKIPTPLGKGKTPLEALNSLINEVWKESRNEEYDERKF